MGQKKIKAERRRQRELVRKVAEKNSKKSYLKLWVGGAILAAVGTIGGILGFSGSDLEKKVAKEKIVLKKEYSYVEAARSENQAVRQKHIDQVVARFPPPVEVAVRYFHDKEHYPNPLFKKRDMIMRTGFEGDKENPVENIRMQIFRAAFRDCQNKDEFLSSLVDHEYDHLKVLAGKDQINIDQSSLEEFYERALTVEGDLFEHYLELRAFSSQIKEFSKRKNVRDSFKENIISTYHAYRDLVAKKKSTPLTRWLLKEFPKIDVEKYVNKWSFLEREYKDDWDIDEVLKKGIVIGIEIPVHRSSPEFKEAMDSLDPRYVRERIRAHGMDPERKYDIRITEQMYGIPEEPWFVKNLVNHYRESIKFLYENLEGLEDYDLEEVIIKPGEDYTDNFDKKAFFGNSFYLVQRIHFRDAEKQSIKFHISRSKHQRGGSNLSQIDKETNEYKCKYIFISTGSSALVSPLSEGVPLTTLKKSSEYANQVGIVRATKADEAISEVIARDLALKRVKILKIPKGVEIIEYHNKRMIKMSPNYKFLPAAMKWVEKHGIQDAFNLYMKDPAEFMKAIKKEG